VAGKTKLRLGDLVSIPSIDEQVAYSLVVGKYHTAFFVAVYDGVYQPGDQDALASAKTAAFALIALTFDAKVVNGQWPVLGRMDFSPDEIPFPAYRLDDGGRALVEDHTGTQSRPARTSVEQSLRYRKLISPQILEDAVKALSQAAPWIPNYDALVVPPPGARSSDLFPAS